MKIKFWLFIIFVLSIVLRFWQLGSNPPALDWDEASLGYNAYSILKTSKDEYGNFLPASIRSFNDYKPPLYTYLTILPVSILGLTEISVRIISALFGVISVVSSFYLVRELFKSRKLALIASFFLAVSPWAIQFSRIAFEANIALSLIILAVLFFLRGLRNGRDLFLSSVFFGFSFYAYHSPRLIVPVFIAGLVLIYISNLKRKLSFLAVFFITLAVFFLPIIKDLSLSSFSTIGA